MAVQIHPTALVDSGAQIGDHVSIGPFCQVGANVTLKDNVRLRQNVIIDGLTTIGQETEIFPFAVLGLPPQDRKYQGEMSELIIGRNNCIREYVTIHPGTAKDKMVTSIGDNNLFLIGCHVAHDCRLGDGILLSNAVNLGGHVEIGDYAVIGGQTGIHQRIRIGQYAMVGGMSGVVRDIIPYALARGNRASLCGINVIGLKRHHFDKNTIHLLHQVYQHLFKEKKGMTFLERVKHLTSLYGEPQVIIDIMRFIAQTTRGICMETTRMSFDGEEKGNFT